MKKIISDKYTQIAILLLGILIVSLIPLFYIGMYAHPCADDFSYGYYTHAFWTTTHSLSETLKWAFQQVKDSYYTWQGTFSSIFIMTLSPAVWGEGFYFLTPIIMLSMLMGSHFYLLYVIIVKMLKGPKSIWITASSVITFLMIQTVYSPVNAFFWFNGSVHYNFMHACMILLFGFALHMNATDKVYKEVLLCIGACLMAVLCGGSNYSTALLGILGSAVILIGQWIKRKKAFWYFLPLVVYGICFYINVSAPGNQVRQTNFNKNTPLNAIIQSFTNENGYIKDCMSIQIILFMLLMIPALWKLTEKLKYKLWLPVVITILSYCSVACMFTPSCYAMSSAGPERLLNIIKFWFILLLFINEGCWIGYIRQKLNGKKTKIKIDARVYVAIILICILAAFILQPGKRMFDYSSYGAFVSLRAGEAQKYHQEYLARVEILESDEPVVVLTEFMWKPRLLYFDDITTDRYNWKNNAMCRWYQKEGVILQELP